MKPMTTIRQYQASDESQLRDLAVQNYAALQPADAPADYETAAISAYFRHIIEIQEKHTGCVLVAEKEKTLIGFVCLMGPIPPSSVETTEEPYAFMSDLFVSKAFRYQGVGTLLIRKAEDRARSMGIRKIALRVAANNETARKIYTANRYTENFVVMSKDLGQ